MAGKVKRLLFQANEKMPALPGVTAMAETHHVTWDCAEEEFVADADSAISFADPAAFVAFPDWISRDGAVVSLQVRERKAGREARESDCLSE